LDRAGSRWPGVWVEGTPGERLMIEQGDEDASPAAPKATDQAQAGGIALAALGSERGGEIEQGAVGDGIVGLAADQEQPECGDGDGQPEAGGAVGILHAGALPLPPRSLGDLEALLDPGAQPVPAGLRSPARSRRAARTSRPPPPRAADR